MKARLENYYNKVWKGKAEPSKEYYGLRCTAANLKVGLSDTTSEVSANTKSKKLKKEKEAERILAKPKITPSVYETLEKKEAYEKKLQEAQKYKFETEKRYNEEMAKRQKRGDIIEKDFFEKQNSITSSILERPLLNPNLLNKQEELRRIKSEFEDGKLKLQKQASSKINELEKQKGVTLKSKTIAPNFMPTKEDIMIDKKEARDLIFATGKVDTTNT